MKLLNPANLLTFLRIILVPFFLVFASSEILEMKYLALVTFLVAVLTDLLDGWLARRRNQVTDLGKLLDPIADKLLVIGSLVVFVQQEIIPAWMAIVIIGREFLITGLRVVGLSKGVVIPAGKWGKHKTAWQGAAIICILMIQCLKASINHWAGPWHQVIMNHPAGGEVVIALLDVLPYCLMFIAVAISLISAFVYLWKNKYLFWH